MTAQLSPAPVFRSWDNLGLPLVNGQLFTYAAGTTNPQATYRDSTQTTPNTNPVILNFRGEAFVWLDPTLTYKFILKDQLGNLIWTEDNIQGGFTPSSIGTSLLPNPTNTYTLGNATFSWANVYVGPNNAPVLDTVSGNIGYYARTAPEIAASVTPLNYSKWPSPWKDISRFVPDNLGTTDYSVQLAAAFAAERNIIIPEGIYLFGSSFGGPIILRQGMTVTGAGRGVLSNFTAAIKVASNTITPFATANTSAGTGGIVLSDFAIFGPGGSLSTVPGLSFVSAYECILDRVLITGFGVGWALSQGISSNSSFLDCANDCVIASNGVNISATLNSNALTLRNTTFGGGPATYGIKYYDSDGLTIYGGDVEGVTVCAIDLDQTLGPPIGGHLITGLHCEANTSSAGDIRIGNTAQVIAVAIEGCVFSPGGSNPYPINAQNVDGLKIDSCALLAGYATSPFNIVNVFNLNVINSPGFFAGGSAVAGQTQYTTGAKAVGHGASAVALVNGASIVTARKRAERFSATGNVTGVGLNAGTSPGQQFTMINESTFTVTFASVVGGGGVANGTSCVIAAQTQKTFYWDTGTSLWYSN